VINHEKNPRQKRAADQPAEQSTPASPWKAKRILVPGIKENHKKIEQSPVTKRDSVEKEMPKKAAKVSTTQKIDDNAES